MIQEGGCIMCKCIFCNKDSDTKVIVSDKSKKYTFYVCDVHIRKPLNDLLYVITDKYR